MKLLTLFVGPPMGTVVESWSLAGKRLQLLEGRYLEVDGERVASVGWYGEWPLDVGGHKFVFKCTPSFPARREEVFSGPHLVPPISATYVGAPDGTACSCTLPAGFACARCGAFTCGTCASPDFVHCGTCFPIVARVAARRAAWRRWRTLAPPLLIIVLAVASCVGMVMADTFAR